MKKILLSLAFVVLMLTGATNVSAQRQLYHNSGDTIDNMDTIYDLQGRKVYDDENISDISHTIDVRELKKGAYVVVVHNQQGVCTKKLVLQ